MECLYAAMERKLGSVTCRAEGVVFVISMAVGHRKGTFGTMSR